MSASDQPAGGAVFLSYAREDTASASRIADALRGFGVEVWFDQNELRGGETWDAKIKKQIRECALFVAVISGHTQARGEGYFRREWKLAVDRTHDMHEGVPFLVPVAVDHTAEDEALVPEQFMRVQWTRLEDGAPTPEFVAQVKRLLAPLKAAAAHGAGDQGHAARRQPGAAARPSSIPTGYAGSAARTAAMADQGLPGEPASRRPAVWIWGGLAAVLIAAVIGFWQWRHAAAPTSAANSALLTGPAAAPSPPTAAAVPEKSIAVLPFENMSEEKDSGFFADGVHEDILTNLALVRELHVVSRTSVMQYRNTTKTIRQIAQELGVAYILEGSVRRAGNRVRVTGQLIHATTDEHVWAKNYDRELTDVFSIQSALAGEIASALQTALSPQEKELLDRRPTENLAAYDAYLKARNLRQTSISPVQMADVEGLLQKAVQLDPNFAAAWALLGSYHAFVYFQEIDQTAERLEKAKNAIDTAGRLAPDAPEVIEMQGDYYYYGYRDYESATEQYRRLAILKPNDCEVFGSLGLIHRRQGRWHEALDDLRRAVQLEPSNLRYRRALYQTTQALWLYDETIAVQRRTKDLAPQDLFEQSYGPYLPYIAFGNPAPSNAWVAQLTPEQKRDSSMIAVRKLWTVASGDFAGYLALDRQERYSDYTGLARPVQDATTALVLAASGDQAAARARATEALAELQIGVEHQPSNASFWANLGLVHALLGNRTEALRCAQKAKEILPESRDAVEGPSYCQSYGWCLAWLGDKDGALGELARLLRTPYGENIYVAKNSPGWFPLRGDPRFEALVSNPKNNAPLF